MLVRLWFQMSGRCVLDSDEGIIGIQMLEALRAEFRVFFHGQDYLGTLPWVIGSPGLLLFGAHPNGLRIIFIIYVLIILLLWRGILRRLGAAGAWPWLAIILGVAPAFMVEYTLRARGTVEGLLAGSVWLWVVVRILADTRSFEAMRHWMFALGVITGLAWWTTQLTIFFFVPGAVLFLSDKRVLGELRHLASHPMSLVWVVACILTTAVFLRATLHYRSPSQELLWGMRIHLQAAWLVVLVAMCILAWRNSLPRWSALALLGLIVGYLPVLSVVWSKEIIYNTTSLQPLYALKGNLLSFLLLGSLDLLGIGSERTHWSATSAASAIFAAGVMVAAVALVVTALVSTLRLRKAPERLDLLLFAACTWSVFFYCIAASSTVKLGHYGTFAGFFLLMTVAVFFWRLSLINRWAAIAAAAVLLLIQASSIVQTEKTDIDWRTGVERDDADAIRFLLDQEITIAATSLTSSSTGYWEAYRLTFSSGERLRVHPILHMPRIERYREELQAADRTAIVTTSPEVVMLVFKEEEIHHETTRFGRLTVIHDFDKAHVDERGLIDYRRRLDE